MELKDATPVAAVVAMRFVTTVFPRTRLEPPSPVSDTFPVKPLNEVTPMLYRVSVLPDVAIPIPDPATVMTVSPVA